jgi:hypothetical protein
MGGGISSHESTSKMPLNPKPLLSTILPVDESTSQTLRTSSLKSKNLKLRKRGVVDRFLELFYIHGDGFENALHLLINSKAKQFFLSSMKDKLTEDELAFAKVISLF